MAEYIQKGGVLSPEWTRGDNMIRLPLRWLAKALFGLDVKGLEHFRDVKKDEPLVIMANHVSYLDPVMLALILPVKPAFAMDTAQYERLSKKPVIGRLMKRVSIFTIDAQSPQSLKGLTRAAQKNMPIMIFPEGALTRTGTLMQVFDGTASIIESARAKVVAFHLDGFEFLRGMTPNLKYYPKKLFPKLSIAAGPVQTFDLPDGLGLKDRRAARFALLQKMFYETPLLSESTGKPLIAALRTAARNFGRGHVVLDDVENNEMTYGKLLTAAYVLEGKLRKILPAPQKGGGRHEAVGVLLPNSSGAATTFFALQAGGHLTAMLNPKAGIATMESCVGTAQIKTVLTSRRFVEMGKLQGEIEALSKTCKIVYLDDVKQSVGWLDKMKGYMRMRGWLTPPGGNGDGKDPAVVLFTSGSEGVPKGVVLSAQNFLSNIAQTRSVVSFTPDDKVFNAMPLFHSFGLTGGMLMPLLTGVPTYQYPTPLDGKIIPKAVYYSNSTIMFGTDTFLNLYARSATGHDFGRIKTIFAGAERLKPETFDLYVEKYGIRINQGYGMTEGAPVVAINTREFHKKGTVGRFVPGMQARFEDVPGIENGRRLYVRGPNIMLGYMKNDRPGIIQAPEGGWHDTGDIVAVDREGYVSITGRAKRFAKIGGEMVSLDAVEIIARNASQEPTAEHAVILKQDPSGDSLIMATTDPALKREQLVKTAQEEGKSVLGIPRDRDIVVLAALPKLSTGKTDYVALKAMLMDDFAKAAAVTAAAAPSAKMEGTSAPAATAPSRDLRLS